MKKFICPYCLTRHTEADLIYRCTAQNCTYKVPRGENGIIPYKYVPTCTKKCDQRFLAFCPHPSSQGQKIIPPNAMNQSMSLALLGGRNSGKSNYIAILVNEIKRKMALPFNCSIKESDDSTQTRYDEYFYKPIFKGNRPLDSTSSGRQDPLLFSVDFYRNNRILDSLLLPLYDTAGENIENQAVLMENANYILNAGGIILLLDPFEIEEITDVLKENGVRLPNVQAEKMENILNRLQILLQRGDSKKVIQTPIAIVLTKLDLLTDYSTLIPEDSPLRRECTHLADGGFSKREFTAVDSAVRELLNGCSEASNLFMKLKAFKNAAFFAVTSFGCDPEMSDLKRSMKPRRVLDPLLWLLAINGYIKTVR